MRLRKTNLYKFSHIQVEKLSSWLFVVSELLEITQKVSFPPTIFQQRHYNLDFYPKLPPACSTLSQKSCLYDKRIHLNKNRNFTYNSYVDSLGIFVRTNEVLFYTVQNTINCSIKNLVWKIKKLDKISSYFLFT